jgi:hypothetical protein
MSPLITARVVRTACDTGHLLNVCSSISETEIGGSPVEGPLSVSTRRESKPSAHIRKQPIFTLHMDKSLSVINRNASVSVR